MMDIRMIASDVDATILPHGGRISEATKGAVRALSDRGIDFVISSGRWYLTARRIAKEIGIEKGYMIIASGGAVVDMDGVPLREWTMPGADARKAYAILKKHNVLINSFVRNALYQVNTAAIPNYKYGILEYYGDFRRVTDDTEAFEAEALDGVYKFEAYTDDPSILERIKPDLIEAGLQVSSSYLNNIEVAGVGMGKGKALRWLAEHRGISMEQVMAFGDNSNDLNMLSAVGWPVAVGNALDEVKAVARLVGDTCENDGVAKVIEKYVLGEETPC